MFFLIVSSIIFLFFAIIAKSDNIPDIILKMVMWVMWVWGLITIMSILFPETTINGMRVF